MSLIAFGGMTALSKRCYHPFGRYYMNCAIEPFRLKFRRRKQGRNAEWHAWLCFEADGSEVELLHLAAANKRDIQKAMGKMLDDWGMNLSLLASEARKDDICRIDGKMVNTDWIIDQEDW